MNRLTLLALAVTLVAAPPASAQPDDGGRPRTPLLDDVQQLIAGERFSDAAARLANSASQTRGAGALLDGLSPWVLHPDPTLAAAAVAAVDALVGDPLRPWEPDGSVQRAAARLAALVEVPDTPAALCAAALGAMGTLQDGWGLRPPSELACALASADEEVLQALRLVRGDAPQQTGPAAPAP